MAAFNSQRLANQFPTWSRVRKDPASMGQRFLSVFSDVYQEISINQLRMDQSFHIEKPFLGPGELHTLTLAEADYIQKTRTTGGALTYTYPTTVVGDGFTAERLDTYEELAWGKPSRLSLAATDTATTTLVWSSAAPTVYTALPQADFLWLTIDGSTEWLKQTYDRHRLYNNTPFVRIRGRDVNEVEVIEVVPVRDDGHYRTRLIFHEVLEVEHQGFDGTLEIRWASANQTQFVDPWRILTFDDFEAPLKMNLEQAVVNSVTESFVIYSGDRFQDGADYRRPDVEDMESNEEHSRVVLKDSAGVETKVVDGCVSPRNTKLYTIDSTGIVHVYDHALPNFVPAIIEETSSTDIYVEAQHVNSYATYGDTQNVFFGNTRPRFPVESMTVRRMAPDLTVDYLQADRTWAAVAYTFPFNTDLGRKVFQTITASTVYDQIGQWEYDVSVQTSEDITNSVSVVVVGSMNAVVSIDSGIANPTGLSFDRQGRLRVHEVGSVHYFDELVDGYIADEVRQQLIFTTDYSSVEVTY